MQVVNRVIDKQIIPVYSDIIMKEYSEVLHRNKFGFSDNAVEYLLSTIREFGIYTDPKPVNLILPDMKDLPFYEVVIDKRDKDAYLVTGNIKHFPKEPFIVTARQMIILTNEIKCRIISFGV